MGCQKITTVLRERGGCGPDCGSGSGPVRGVEDGGETQRDSGHGEGGRAVWRGTPDLVPPKEADGLAGDSPAPGLGSPVSDGVYVVYPSGAKRSDLTARYDLVPAEGLRRAAETMARGAATYGENNWQKGMPLSHCLNHAVAHIFRYLEGDRSEDHLAHAACNLLMARHFEEVNP